MFPAIASLLPQSESKSLKWLLVCSWNGGKQVGKSCLQYLSSIVFCDNNILLNTLASAISFEKHVNEEDFVQKQVEAGAIVALAGCL
jgi:hypothetical protein